MSGTDQPEKRREILSDASLPGSYVAFFDATAVPLSDSVSFLSNQLIADYSNIHIYRGRRFTASSRSSLAALSCTHKQGQSHIYTSRHSQSGSSLFLMANVYLLRALMRAK